MGDTINYLPTGCSIGTKKYKPLVFHRALTKSGCKKRRASPSQYGPLAQLVNSKQRVFEYFLRPFSTGRNFPRGAVFPLFKDQLAESGRRKTKENIIPRGKFRLVENGPYNRMKLRISSLSSTGGGSKERPSPKPCAPS